MVNYVTLVKSMANHDTSNACQDHGMITMVCLDSYQGYHVKNSIKPFSVIDRVPTSWKESCSFFSLPS